MKQLIERYQTQNYDHPVLKLKSNVNVGFESFKDTIESFLKQNEYSFQRKDSGTVFCMIKTLNKTSFDHYFEMALEYTHKNSEFKTWGFDYGDTNIIFISFKD